MINWLSTVLLRRPSLRAGPGQHRHSSHTRPTNGQFVSFLQGTHFRRVNPDAYERSLRRRRVAMAVFTWAAVAGFAWVVIESAQALSMF
jgi:hypothetical protein